MLGSVPFTFGIWCVSFIYSCRFSKGKGSLGNVQDTMRGSAVRGEGVVLGSNDASGLSTF